MARVFCLRDESSATESMGDHGKSALFFLFRRRVEEDQQENRRTEGNSRGDQENLPKIKSAASIGESGPQLSADEVPDEGADAQNQHVEQSLCAGTRVLGEKLIDEDVDGGKE